MEFYRVSVHLQGFASLAILLIALISGQSTSTKEVKTLAFYGSICFLFYLGQKLFPTQYINLIGDFFVLFEISILLSLYYQLNRSKRTRILITVVAAGFFILFISYLFRDQKGLGADIRSYRDAAMILFSVNFFIRMLNNLTEQDLTSHSMFWINSAILFFFSCTLMLSLSMTYIAEVMRDDFAFFWAFGIFYELVFVWFFVLEFGRHVNLRLQNDDSHDFRGIQYSTMGRQLCHCSISAKELQQAHKTNNYSWDSRGFECDLSVSSDHR